MLACPRRAGAGSGTGKASSMVHTGAAQPHATVPITLTEDDPVARVRQSRRCRARRKNGEPCKAYAITGGYVCRMHGGASPRAQYAAYVRRFEAGFQRQFAREYARWRKELAAWQARRILITSELLGIPPQKVQPVDIGSCRGLYGRPDGPETAPKMRTDHRFRPRQPATA